MFVIAQQFNLTFLGSKRQQSHSLIIYVRYLPSHVFYTAEMSSFIQRNARVIEFCVLHSAYAWINCLNPPYAIRLQSNS